MNFTSYRMQLMKAGSAISLAGLIAATSLSAESMGMQDQIGSIAPGLQADIIAMDGDLLKDPTAIRWVVFAMKGGTVFRNVVSKAAGTPNLANQ